MYHFLAKHAHLQPLFKIKNSQLLFEFEENKVSARIGGLRRK